jgi:dihydrofolate synthase/folylpolyglutamate synthase
LTYEQTLAYLFAKLPMYQRIGAVAYKKDLTNTLALCAALGNPQNSFKAVHVAGTNGKGSTSHILSSMYQNNGYKVGLYTSPHLVDFRERIKINGELCSKEFVIQFTATIAPLIEQLKPSFFEITVAMAFSYFAEQKVDIAIIETGLGGRLDSTNIILPLASVITSIGYDHKDMLGDTLELIAGEKAGIIKPNVPVVTGNISERPLQVILAKAKEQEAQHFTYQTHSFISDLKGKHQSWNIGCALQVTAYALEHVCSISNFEGRWQKLHDSPLVICDVAHNEEGIGLIADEIRNLGLYVYFILGFVSDKELNKIVPLLPPAQSIHLVKPQVIRGMETDIAADSFTSFGILTSQHATLLDAINESLRQISDSDHADSSLLFIGGSNFVVADLLQLKAEHKLPWT